MTETPAARLRVPAGMSTAHLARCVAGDGHAVVLDGWGWGGGVVRIAVGSRLVSAVEAITLFDAGDPTPRSGLRPGSLVGHINYDGGDSGERRRQSLADGGAALDGVFLVVDRVLTASGQDVVHGDTVWEVDDGADAQWLAEVSSRLTAQTVVERRGDRAVAGAGGRGTTPGGRGGVVGAADLSDEAYLRAITSSIDAIAEGDAYVVCLTTQHTLPPVDAATLHERLAGDTKERFQAFFDFPDAALVAASPELYLHIDTDRRVHSEPIKGTAPRGDDPTTDAIHAAELADSAKERAENVMIVDLVRNDLARVSVPGGVRVDRLCEVQAHPRVHQLVSAVSAPLAAGRGLADTLRASFPAGSMTGAPKSSAMTIIADREPRARGQYAGAYGVLTPGGTATLAMTIRTAVITADATRIGTGGGITAHSDPATELGEMHLKAAALIHTVTAIQTESGSREPRVPGTGHEL